MNRVMQVGFSDEGERLIARPEGRFDVADGDELCAAVEQRLSAATKFVTIDLAGLEFVSLGGVRAILRLGRSLKRSDRELQFRHGSDAVREALHQAGFNNFFAFTPAFQSHGGHYDQTS